MSHVVYSAFSSCVSSHSHAANFFKQPETHYKIVKATEAIFETAGEIAKSTHAAESTVAGIAFGQGTIKTIGNVLGGVYLFTGVIPSLLFSIKLGVDLIKSVYDSEEVPLHPYKNEDELFFNEIAISIKEKVLAFCALVAKCIKASCALASFALHHLGDDRKYHSLMLIKHGSTALGYALEMGYQTSAYQRLTSEQENGQGYLLYIKTMQELTLGIIEKLLLLLRDLAHLLDAAPPPQFRLPVSLLVGAISLYRTWLRTA